MNNSENGTPSAVGVKWPEVGVALLLLGLAAAVVMDSLRIGIGWADDGPRSGYFPFIVGSLLGGSALWILIDQIRNWARSDEEFAERAQLVQVMQMLVPVILYVTAIAFIGLYVASTALIAWFMLRHGKYRSLPTLAVSLGVPLVAFLVFERWFLVPLPKGPLEAAFGL